jgi:chromosome segregation ATPase
MGKTQLGGAQRGAGSGDRDQIRQHDRDRIQATDSQRDQVRDCIGSADRTRTQARDMQKLAKSGKFNQQTAMQQRDRLQGELRNMDQNHERLMQGFSPEQRVSAQERIRAMEQARERANTRLREMNRELAQANPDRNHLQQQARDMEESMQRWRNQYQQMASDMQP